MTAPIDFATCYETTLRDSLTALESTRKALMRAYLRVLAGAGAVLLLGFALIAFLTDDLLVPTIVVAALVAVVGGWRVGPRKREYTAGFKKGVIAQMVAAIDSRLTYEPEHSIDEATFERSGIFNHSIDRYSGDDLVAGTVGATALRFSEIHAEYKTQTVDSKGRTRTHWHTIFKGLFFEADFHKAFHGETYVRTDVAEKLFGVLGQSLQKPLFGSTELVKLEDPEFETEFVVTSTDQQEARYILSPALMARMLDFKRKADRDVQFSFIGTNVYAAVPYSEDLFEPPVWRTVMNPALLESYYEALRLVFAAVDDLNLNTRIWSKTPSAV